VVSAGLNFFLVALNYPDKFVRRRFFREGDEKFGTNKFTAVFVQVNEVIFFFHFTNNCAFSIIITISDEMLLIREGPILMTGVIIEISFFHDIPGKDRTNYTIFGPVLQDTLYLWLWEIRVVYQFEKWAR
jgi:hypothetical protein